MNSRSAFTVAAMAAALEETSVSFEDLADIEKDFDDVETEISRVSLHSFFFFNSQLSKFPIACPPKYLSLFFMFPIPDLEFRVFCPAFSFHNLTDLSPYFIFADHKFSRFF